jgi:hypothetical protein
VFPEPLLLGGGLSVSTALFKIRAVKRVSKTAFIGNRIKRRLVQIRYRLCESAIIATIIFERVVDGVVMVLILSLLFHVFTMPNRLRLTATSAGVVLFAMAA